MVSARLGPERGSPIVGPVAPDHTLRRRWARYRALTRRVGGHRRRKGRFPPLARRPPFRSASVLVGDFEHSLNGLRRPHPTTGAVGMGQPDAFGDLSRRETPRAQLVEPSDGIEDLAEVLVLRGCHRGMQGVSFRIAVHPAALPLALVRRRVGRVARLNVRGNVDAAPACGRTSPLQCLQLQNKGNILGDSWTEADIDPANQPLVAQPVWLFGSISAGTPFVVVSSEPGIGTCKFQQERHMV